jgi:hypothetical protein
MSDEAKVRELLAPFAERSVDLEGREFPVNREAAVAVILKAAQQGPRVRPQRLAVWGGGGAAALALAAAALLFLGRSGGGVPAAAASATVGDVAGVVTHWQAGASRAVPAGRDALAIESSGELRTSGASSARVKNARGDEVALFENSRLVLSGFDQAASSVQLLAGSIRCDVPDLAPGQRFSVVTPQGTVEVRGTAFTVLVSGMAEAARTCVKVERGAVAIITSGSEKHVGAGQSWGCEAEKEAAPAGVQGRAAAAGEAPAVDESAPGPRGSARVNDRGEGKAPKVGTLDEENRLFQAGLAAERQRDFARARAAFDQLLTRFPASPLANDARVARGRVQGQAPTP